MGNEYGKVENTTLVNPGLGMGAEKELPFFKKFWTTIIIFTSINLI